MDPIGNTDYNLPSLDAHILSQQNSQTQMMVAFACQLIKSVSETFGFNNATQMARTAASYSQLLIGTKMLQTGELGKMYVQSSPSSQNAEDRATFWRTMQIYITLSRPMMESMHNVIAPSLPQVAKYIGSTTVDSVDLAVGLIQKSESSLASYGTLLHNRSLSTYEKVSKIADIIYTVSSFAANALPIVQSGLITSCAAVAVMAGVVKVFSMFITTRRIFKDEFTILKEDVVRALKQQVLITKKSIERNLNHNDEYDIRERGNFKDNLTQVENAQNAIELCKAVNIFIRDFIQSEEVYLFSHEESVSSEQVEAFFAIQSESERAVISTIDKVEGQLMDYMSRLEILLTAQLWQEGSSKDSDILWQKKMQGEMQQIRNQLDAVNGRAQALAYHTTGLTLPMEKGAPLDIEAWLLRSKAILDPEREKILEKLAVELSSRKI